MKLVRYGAAGREKPGLIDGSGVLRDLSKTKELVGRALEAWEKLPDGVPDGETVCHLIESLADV